MCFVCPIVIVVQLMTDTPILDKVAEIIGQATSNKQSMDNNNGRPLCADWIGGCLYRYCQIATILFMIRKLPTTELNLIASSRSLVVLYDAGYN